MNKLPALVLLLILASPAGADDDLIEPSAPIREAAPGLYLVAVETAEQGRPLRCTPLRLHGGKLTQAEALTVTFDRRLLHTGRPALAIDGDELYVADGQRLTRHRPFDAAAARPVASVALPGPATALHARNGLVYAGGPAHVWAVDWRGTPPVARELAAGAEATRPIDFFVRLPRALVAVDNILVRKYAFLFDIAASGAVRFRARAHLLDHVNGQLLCGARAGDALFLVGSFATLRGAGNTLHMARLDGDRISSTVVHTEYGSTWTGIGVLAGKLLVGASSKGILVFDPAAPGAAPAAIDTGGRCLSLIVAGDRALALIALPSGKRVLREYCWREGGAGFASTAEHPLPARAAALAR